MTSSEEKADAWRIAASWLDDGSMNWDLGDKYTPEGDWTPEQIASAERVRKHIREVVVPHMKRQAERIERNRNNA